MPRNYSSASHSFVAYSGLLAAVHCAQLDQTVSELPGSRVRLGAQRAPAPVMSLACLLPSFFLGRTNIPLL